MNRHLAVAAATTIALASLTGCATLDERGTKVFPVIAVRGIPAGLGVNIHFYEGNEKDWDMLAEAGVRIVRMDVGWSGCEKKPGEYDFSRYDALIDRLEKHYIRLIFIIDYGNPLYDGGLAPHTDEGRAAYARFVSALVKRYKGKPIIWELWNEPNIGFWKPKPNVDDYMAWCKAVVPAIRQSDPNACVVGPATAGIAFGFLEQCFRRGLLELVDGVSVHPYRDAKRGPETAIPEYKKLARLIEQYAPMIGPESQARRKIIPILSGEWGYSSTYVSRDVQGKYLARQWLANTASGLPISIWYDWHDDGKDPKEKEHNFGTVTWDYKPKPAYLAAKTLIDQLGGCQIIDRIRTGSDDDFVLVLVLGHGTQLKLAAWTTGEPHEVDLGPGVKIAGAVDHLGNKLDVPDGSRQLLTDAPRYLTLAPPIPGWLGVLVQPTLLPRTAWSADYVLFVVMFNVGDRPARVTLEPVSGPDVYVTGEWIGSVFSDPNELLPPHESRFDMWAGNSYRHDPGPVTLTVTARIAAEGEEPHVVRRTVEAGALCRVDLDLAWRRDGLQVSVNTNSERPLTGSVIPNVDGVDRRAIGVALAPGKRSAVVRWDEIRLDGVARHVGVRFVGATGRVLAKIDPMTYELVDAIDAPLGSDATRAYRLWDEGAPDRKATLTGTIVDAPGADPPFPKAVKVDFRMGAGWCFWQLGPKQPLQILPDGVAPKQIMLWVRGDAPSDAIRCRVADATGQTLQPGGGEVGSGNWRMVRMPLERGMGHWGGANDGVLHLPLRWTSYYLQDSTREAHAGTTYLTGVVIAW